MIIGNSRVVQGLRLWASNAGREDSVPGQGTKILYAQRCSQKVKIKKEIIITPHL